MNLTRMDVIVAIANSFNVEKAMVKNLLDKEYPRYFFPLITIAEYQDFLNKHKRELIKNDN